MVGKNKPKTSGFEYGIGNKKMKQMELDFVDLVTKMMTKPYFPTKVTTVVEEMIPPTKKNKKTLKV